MEYDPVIIKSSRLTVEIAQPGTIYTGTRFDWSGFITQVTLDGEHTFCMPESLQPGQGSGGIGLCNEFGNELAVGYDEVQPGESFPKLGIGLLKRPDEGKYSFFRPHEIVEKFPIQVDSGADQARFTVHPVECRGYATKLEKTLRVVENSLIIDYRLENTGSKPIFTHEYYHNFLGINRQPVGPAYRLHFPQPVRREPPPADMYKLAPPKLRWLPKSILKWVINIYMARMVQSMVLNGDEITWDETPKGFFFSRLAGFQPRQEAQWELIHKPSGLSVCEVDDFSPTRLVVWGTAHVVSAEVYTDLNIASGDVTHWSRQYLFSINLSG
jgi:hypothetical protein